MKDLPGRVCRLLDAASAVLLALMVALVFGNVVLRYAFNSGITVSEELSRWLFVWLTFLGAAVAVHEHAHLGTDALVGRLGHRGRRVCGLLALLTMLVLTAMTFWGSLTQARINWDVEAPVTGASMAWLYGAGVVFAAITFALLLAQTLRAASGRMTDDELVLAQESEDLAALQRGPHAPGGSAQQAPR